MPCFLLSPQGRVSLPLDKHFFFGRAESNNIVVDDVRSSRRHAEIYHDGSEFILMDLNSSNGTFVNDKRVSSHLLKDGDAIQIGFQTYTFRMVEDDADLDKSVERLRKDTAAMATCEMPAFNADQFPPTDFNGTLAAMNAGELVSMLSFTKRSGMLLLMNEKREKGIIYLKDGEIISADQVTFEGDEAVLRILRTFKEGTFSFRTQHPTPKLNVTQPTGQLLLEAARQSDEIR